MHLDYRVRRGRNLEAERRQLVLVQDDEPALQRGLMPTQIGLNQRQFLLQISAPSGKFRRDRGRLCARIRRSVPGKVKRDPR